MFLRNKRTDFDKEEFDYTSVPKHFRSVADTEIDKTRKRCLRSIRAKYHKDGYPAKVLGDMLRSISGDFNLLYNDLEGDYSTRKNNLKMAYNNGLASINQQIDDFDLIVSDYKKACLSYSRAIKQATGQDFDETLVFDEKKLELIKSEVNKMLEKQRNF